MAYRKVDPINPVKLNISLNNFDNSKSDKQSKSEDLSFDKLFKAECKRLKDEGK